MERTTLMCGRGARLALRRMARLLADEPSARRQCVNALVEQVLLLFNTHGYYCYLCVVVHVDDRLVF
jgi:hypothetical protein